MEDLCDVELGPCVESNYVHPKRLKYTQNGKKRIWDMVLVHDSVAVLIFNKSRNVMVFVKQFRPAVYLNNIPEDKRDKIDVKEYPAALGVTLELCAGIVDKSCSLAEIARQEVLEECGYDAPLQSIRPVLKFKSGIGATGSQQTIFYAEVTDNMIVSQGGGNPEEGELIDVVEMSVQECHEYVNRESVQSPAGFMFALMWFFANIAPSLEAS